MALLHLDALEYVKQAKVLGEKEELAEHQVRFIEQAIGIAAEKNNHFSTKHDVTETELKLTKEICAVQKEIEVLRKEIKEVELRLTVRLLTIFGGGFLVLVGMMAKGFHWY